MVPEQLKRPGECSILVCGGRDYDDINTLCDPLDRILAECEDRQLVMIVIQGGATGADAIAREWALLQNGGVELITDPADWNRHGPAAGPIRNQHMLDNYDIEVCVCTEGGAGTADMVRRCEEAGLPVLRPVAPPALEGDEI